MGSAGWATWDRPPSGEDWPLSWRASSPPPQQGSQADTPPQFVGLGSAPRCHQAGLSLPLTRPRSASSGTLDGRCLCRHPGVGTPEQLMSVGVPWAAGHADCCPPALALGAPSWGPMGFPATQPRRFSLRPQDVEAAIMMVKTCALCPLDTRHWGTHGGAALPSVAHRRSNYKRARTERAPSSSSTHPQLHGCELTRGAQPETTG